MYVKDYIAELNTDLDSYYDGIPDDGNYNKSLNSALLMSLNRMKEMCSKDPEVYHRDPEVYHRDPYTIDFETAALFTQTDIPLKSLCEKIQPKIKSYELTIKIRNVSLATEKNENGEVVLKCTERFNEQSRVNGHRR